MEKFVESNDGKGLGTFLNKFGEVANPTTVGKIMEKGPGQVTYREVLDLLNYAKQKGTLNDNGKSVVQVLNNTFDQAIKSAGKTAQVQD